MNSEAIKKNINMIINQKINIEHMFTQLEFGSLCGVSKTTVAKWCIDTCPAADKIPAICDNLKITIHELLGINSPSDLTQEDIDLLNKIKSNPPLMDVVKRYKF